jgi:hypothetical protein
MRRILIVDEDVNQIRVFALELKCEESKSFRAELPTNAFAFWRTIKNFLLDSYT